MAWQAGRASRVGILFGFVLDKGSLTLRIHYIEEEKETMKKLVLILSAIVVLVAFAVPVFAMDMYDPEQRLAKLYDEKASPVKLSGEFTFGMLTPFDSDYAAIGFSNAYVDFNWWPDEYNTLLMELAASKEYSQTGNTGTPTITYFELTTDIGSYFGLPIGLKNTAGVTSLYTNKYEVTGHAWERTKVRSDIDPLAWKIWLDFGVVQVTTAIGFGERTNDSSVSWASPADDAGTNVKGAYNDFGIYAFLPAVGPVEIEAWYLAQDNPDLKGALGGTVKADGLVNGMLGVAGGFVYDLRTIADGGGSSSYIGGYGYRTGGSLPSTSDHWWAWGAGVSVDLMGAAIGVSANGDVGAVFDQLAVDVDYAFGDFGVIATGAFTFSEDAKSNYLGSEFGVYVKVGGAKWTVGYLLDGDNSDNYGYSYSVAYVFADSKGGLFMVADIDF